jgi:aminomethyltransferase
MALHQSPLHAEHVALGARMVEFGGWEMPIQYTSVLEEHRACRNDAVVFDVSHLGTVEVAGPGAFALLQWAFTNDLGRIAPGRAQYTHLLDTVDAHVVDDIIIWWVGDDQFSVMPNASNVSRLTAALAEFDDPEGDTTVRDTTANRAVLAVQGPHARERLATIDPQFATVERFGVVAVAWNGASCLIAGTGYTGEDGVEIQIPNARAADLWRAIIGAGVTPAGLGARDTLRLEAGLPLHGHELGEGTTPLQAGLAWVVRFDKGDFRGRAPLLAERDRGIARRLVGLAVDGRQPPRAGSAVVAGGVEVGVVTSGNFSPVLGHGVALAFVRPDMAVGSELGIDVRGRVLPARIVALPFVKRG